MNIAEYSIRKPAVTWMIIVFCIIGGIYAYFHLGRYEDPEFTIKDAMVITHYPGATPKEVEEEVTDRIEKEIQKMGQIKRLKSISRYGTSEITVTIKDKFDKSSLPQVWDELRRKVSDIQSKLPPGAGPSLVNDDYGDVFGMLYALTGDGFNYRELKKYADDLKKQILLVSGVAKVTITGDQQEAIFVEISQSRIANLGISLDDIYKTLHSQNLVSYSGEVRVGNEYITLSPSGNVSSVATISNLIVRSKKSNKLFHLNDISNIKRGYQEVPDHIIYYNGQPALSIGISIVPGGNVVKIGAAITEKVKSLAGQIPVGIQIKAIYSQPQMVTKSINGFVISVIEALAIVIAILLMFMGLRCGIIIGAILLLTVLGTLFIMYLFGIDLERISLGALIIGLGMMVDNAIVVAEGILVSVQKGEDKLKASIAVVKKTQWPLFGATLVGILAFAAVSMSEDSTGEYTRSLFSVIFISLMLSWFLAITVAPMFCYHLLKPGKESNKPVHSNFIYRFYKSTLTGLLKARWLTVIVMILLLGTSMYAFRYVKQSFFPDSTTPMFYLDYWKPEGTDIRATAEDMQKIREHIKTMQEVKNVTSIVGGGAQRLMLVYEPEKTNSSYGQFIIEVKDYKQINGVSKSIKGYIATKFPNSEPKIRFIRLGPGSGAKIEARFSGPDPQVLRNLSNQAQEIMRQTPGAIDIRDDWRQKVKVIEPVYSQTQARSTGIGFEDVTEALQNAFSGKQVGIYRELDKLIPIVSRPPDKERLNIANIDSVQIWSPVYNKAIPIGQVVSEIKTTWKNSRIHRRNRLMTITTSSEPKSGPASVVYDKMAAKIEAIKLPAGYFMEWGGEYENSHDAQTALAKQLPISIIAMIIVVILLFGTLRQPLIIWLTVPLSIIGVIVGLLATGTEFGFMALLGFLSLSGMLIKNSIVLIDEIDDQIKQGSPVYEAIINSSLSRMRPVALAAITTVLGMIPLLFDAFFVSMAVVIMFGLTFATLLTLVIIPVLYWMFFKKSAKTKQIA